MNFRRTWNKFATAVRRTLNLRHPAWSRAELANQYDNATQLASLHARNARDLYTKLRTAERDNAQLHERKLLQLAPPIKANARRRLTASEARLLIESQGIYSSQKEEDGLG